MILTVGDVDITGRVPGDAIGKAQSGAGGQSAVTGKARSAGARERAGTTGGTDFPDDLRSLLRDVEIARSIRRNAARRRNVRGQTCDDPPGIDLANCGSGSDV